MTALTALNLAVSRCRQALTRSKKQSFERRVDATRALVGAIAKAN